MNDVPQIRFVDPHSESVRRNNHFQLALHKLFLNELALIWDQTCVVRANTDLDLFCNLFDKSFATFSGCCIDDAGPFLIGNELHQLLVLLTVSHALDSP